MRTFAVIHKILRCIFEIVCYTQYVVKRKLYIEFFHDNRRPAKRRFYWCKGPHREVCR